MSFSLNHLADGQVDWFSRVDGNWTTLENRLTESSCALYKSASQAISATTDTAISFDSENYDNGSIHSTSTNNSRITVSAAGRYVFWASVVTDLTTQDLKQWFRINGATVDGYGHCVLPQFSRIDFGLTAVLNLSANDYVELVVNSANACNVVGGNVAGSTFFGAMRLA